MPIIQTYHTMMKRLKQIVSKERITRIRTMAWLQSGILQSRSVHLNRIASKIPGEAKKLSRVRQLERFIDNPRVRVREWYHPVAEGLLKEASANQGTLRLIIDGSKVGNGHQLLMVSLAYRHRALPIAWTWVRCRRGHSTGHKQSALLYVTVVAFGSQTIKNGLRPLVDRNERRDLSIFRIGFDMLERMFANSHSFSIRPLPYFL